MPESPPAERRTALAAALFSPRRIALVGASDDPSRLTSRPQRVLRRHGYPGDIVVVAADRSRSGEADARGGTAIATMPTGIDHALVMTPAIAVERAIEACAAAGAKVATVLTAGFAELGPSGQRRQARLQAAARRSGIRVLGPNSLGVVDVHSRTVLSANAVFEHEPLDPGPIAVVSQSGSMLGAILTRAQARGLRCSKLVAVGNECDLGVGEIVDLLVDDPATEVILLFLEALRDADSLAAAARRACSAGKPVVAYKLGRSAASRELALTHTGATTSPDDVADAFFLEHGILRVRVFEALFESANFVRARRPSRSHRLATVTVSGGGAAMVLDNLADSAIEQSPLPPDGVARLADAGVRVPSSSVIDLPMGRADDGAYAKVLRALLDGTHCDLVLAVLGSNATYQPQSARERILAAGAINKPLAVLLGPRADETDRLLQTHGVAAFRTPEACADALRAYAAWRLPSTRDMPDDTTCERVRAAVRLAGPSPCNEAAAMRAFGALGIEVAPGQVLHSAADRTELPFPVAAKLLSPSLPHKSDVAAVHLDLADAAALRSAIQSLLGIAAHACPGAAVDGVWVQPMQTGVAEMLIGYRFDPEVGPVVVLGPGGIHADLMPGRVVRCAPVDIETARAMIDALPAARMLRGWRGRPAGDIDALARAVRAFSLLALADAPRVLEAEINPLIVKRRGVVAVDALLRLDAVSR